MKQNRHRLEQGRRYGYIAGETLKKAGNPPIFNHRDTETTGDPNDLICFFAAA
jgi:hypothetical protein